ncbi:malto-oligosyltrehalose synthase [Sphingobacterium thalpophilum]|uniref:malto-oligosyltrehalose synthase n=1 Tax=Sphingobacterium thalpophilum TaxID=259 RepID=UPI003C749B31
MHTNKKVSICHQSAPYTTYRIQFHKDFNFSDFELVIDYLQQLGIDTIYAAPILRSVPSSSHGYDGIEMNQIDPELGSLDDFKRIRKKLHQYGIKWLQDIVPNHMAFHTSNQWLMDVLEFGAASRYNRYFDTCLSSNMFEDGKLMVPVLVQSLDDVIHQGHLSLIRNHDKFYLSYQDNFYPLCPESYCYILADNLRKTHGDYNGFLVQINTLQANGNTEEWNSIRQAMISEIGDVELELILQKFNSSGERLRELAHSQYYELCPWWETSKRINYRRFFTVNGLICIHMQDAAVFDHAHQLLNTLIEQGLIDGLRVDHIDGLYNPSQYLHNLRELVGPNTYIVAEKILERGEKLPQNWPIQGTTGYEFLSACNNVFTNRKSKKVFDRYYRKVMGEKQTIKKLQLNKKLHIVREHMSGDVDNLVRMMSALLPAAQDKQDAIKAFVEFFLAYFPLYRVYDDHFPLSQESYALITRLFQKLTCTTELDQQIVQEVWSLFKDAQEGREISTLPALLQLLMRMMQFTGPVMAKGVEDTLMYTYNRFIAHNEVGDHPHNFGFSKKEFHRAMRHRQQYWPLSLNASSTHDTKRGEDARSRLLVLTSIADKWVKQVQIWQDIVWNEYRSDLPHPNDEYFIYQALVSSYPSGKHRKVVDEGFEQRFLDYLVKYLREGKERSNWEEPNFSYENTVQDFARFLFDAKRPFFTSFYQFIEEIADHGMLNSLVQQVLKFTCPGVPDIYQGSELWDYSFVDPDNRRPVDYPLRKQLISDIAAIQEDDLVATLWRERHDGRIKLWLIRELIRLRKTNPALIGSGSYIKLKVSGRYRKHILAFARRSDDNWLVVVVPLHLGALAKAVKFVTGSFDWADTRVCFPTMHKVNWQQVVSENSGEGNEILMNDIFNQLPLAILTFKDKPQNRSAGILLHISSLPSPFGIGDMGKQARRFVDKLQASGQTWWQVLPLGPTDPAQNHSPYSTFSTRSGNPLFIDLKPLIKLGLLDKADLTEVKVNPSLPVDFDSVHAGKLALLSRAYERASREATPAFHDFCLQESVWLNDYALFMVLKEKHGYKPWYTWPEKYRKRDQSALDQFEKAHDYYISREKWMQFLFFSQWESLHQYCKDRGVRLLGDIPFYASYDSADVWANPLYFSIADDSKATMVAGVPPDYFNELGQLWGMPVYNWQTLKKDGYSWWIDRLVHSCKLYDRVRLDHFRAFSAFWKVPVTALSAKEGHWSRGPGAIFFNKVKQAMGSMPFVAEDLGDVDAQVFQLRDQFGFSGMKVLQFAFGEDFACSPHIPHHYQQNFVAYSGTHDNNTTLSWYNQDLDQTAKGRISKYMGRSIDSRSINQSFLHMLYASVADTVIVPMQDLLDLDGSCRMNRPARTTGNWIWRMQKDAFNIAIQKQLLQLTILFNR